MIYAEFRDEMKEVLARRSENKQAVAIGPRTFKRVEEILRRWSGQKEDNLLAANSKKKCWTRRSGEK